MSWTQAALLAVLLALSLSQETDAAAVPDGEDTAKDSRGSLNRIFMQEADASDFFRRRTRRGTKSQDEIDAEQKQVLLADQRKRQYHEENMNEHENYAEEENDGESDAVEENDETDERTRESTEQWRQFHNDGMYPPYDRQ